MYVPKFTEVTDAAVLLDLMRSFNFATLVTAHEGDLQASHVPFTVRAGDPVVLEAHLARANPQAAALEAGADALVVFQGDHAYVSASWYARHPSVPTWNYMVVHAYARPRVVSDADAVRAMLRGLSRRHDAVWDMDALPGEYMDGMMKGIVAFEFDVTRLEGKFKLSQNRSVEDRERVVAHLERSERETERAVARVMREDLK